MRQCRMSGVACLVLVLALLAPRPAAAADPIRIGYLGPLTGIFAQAGKDMLDGLKLALEQANYEAAGRKIELIAEDSEGNPATAFAKYRKLTTHDRIHVLDGILLAHIGYGLMQPIVRGQPADAPARRLRREDAQIQAGRGDRHGQSLRPRADRRLPARVRGKRWT